jgi:phage terminase large subunit
MRLAKRKANVYPADNNVGEGIRCVAALMEGATGLQLVGQAQRPRLFISDKCPLLIACIEGYVHKRDVDGDHTEQPVKKNDDPADALRYLVMGLQSS